jgi:hypothetical protein
MNVGILIVAFKTAQTTTRLRYEQDYLVFGIWSLEFVGAVFVLC